MKNKSLAAIFLGVILVVSAFAGCSSTPGAPSVPDASSTSSAPVSSEMPPDATAALSIQGELRVWGDQPNQTIIAAPFKEINEAFMKEYPDVKVTFDISETDAALQVAIQSDTLPDCFFTGGNKNPQLKQLARAGSILALDGHIDNMNMYDNPSIKRYVEVDGKTYCAPSAFMDSQLVYYNKDLFDQAGVSVPGTWNEFLAMCDGVLAANIQPIAMPGATMWENSWGCFALTAAFATDAMNNVADGKGTWLDPTIVKAFDNTRLLADKGYYGKDYKGMNQQEAQLMFTSGKAAMYIDGTWAKDVYLDSGINLGVFYIPNEEGKKVAALSVNNFMSYSISSNTKNPEAAYAYVNFLAQVPAQQIMQNHTAIPIMVKIVEPANEMVGELSNFDSLGVQMNQVATACASDQYNTSDLLMSTVVPGLVNMELTGQEACQMMDDAATYPTPSN